MTPALRDAAAPVIAAGGDADRLVGALAWLLDPARGAASLRREVARVGGLLDDPAAAVDSVLRPPGPQVEARLRGVLRTWAAHDVVAATVADRGYPRRLADGWPHGDAPALVAWRGAPPVDVPAVAIVGARRATGYGTGVAAWLAAAASAAGVRVVSGGALGIDAAAHLAALDGPGGTTVVLGCGHDVRYPRPHAGPGGLFARTVDAGGTLLTELLPGTPPTPQHVRARNRIVAALADAVVVVEGGARSGALVTASVAADRGVPVLAVPGDVRAPGSVAPHRLLTEGAAPCTSPADLLDALGRVGAGDDVATTRPTTSVLPADVHALLAAAWPRPLPVDELAARTGRATPALLGALTRARVAGETADDASGVRLRRAP